MKLKINSLLESLIIIAIISVFSFPALATNVGGIINANTTWDSAGSPYNLTENVQTNDGVILTIGPGVVVNGYGYKISLRGDLNVNGTELSKIFINNIFLIEQSSATTVNIQFAEINGGTYYFSQDNSRFFLRDSKIQNISGITIFDSGNLNDSFMERNIFLNASGILVGKSTSYVHIRNNAFYQQNGPLRVDGELGEPAHAIIEYNSFLSTDRIALHADTNANITAINNYWNTTDTSVIDSMIFDRNDNLGILYYVEYIPFLTEPHPDTPILDFNQAPISNCGADQVVFDEVTFDGSASYDPDGWIDLYEWKLQHRTNSANNRNASGVNPTITDLSPGFYDVYLTVTDNGGAIGLDCSLLAAAGSCFCTASTIHIEAIEPDLLKADKGEKHGQALVKVFDDCGKPVSGVTVSGTFSGDFTDSISGVTGGDGNALLITTTSTKKKPAFTFCVDDVINGTLPYYPSDNVETCDSFQ
jgi:hypothetical protein